MGAPLGNTNSVKHGGRSKRFGAALTRQKKKLAGAYRDVLQFRGELESLVAAKHGGLSLLRTARIQTVCRLELATRAAEQMLRDDGNLGTSETRQLREMSCRLSAQRDNALADLIGDLPAGRASGSEVADPWGDLLDGGCQVGGESATTTPVIAPAAADSLGLIGEPSGSVEDGDPGGEPVASNASKPPETSSVASKSPEAAETPPHNQDAFPSHTTHRQSGEPNVAAHAADRSESEADGTTHIMENHGR